MTTYCTECGWQDPDDYVEGYAGHIVIVPGHDPNCVDCSDCPIPMQELCGPVIVLPEQPDYLVDYPADELYGGNTGCDHYVVPASGGGVKCAKCTAWFCY